MKQQAFAVVGFSAVLAMFGAIAGTIAVVGPALYGAALLNLTQTRVNGFLLGGLIVSTLAIGGSSAFLMGVHMASLQVVVFITVCVIAWMYHRREVNHRW